MGNCFVSGEDSSCSLPFGSCKISACKSACMKPARELEDVIDEVLKRYIVEHLHPALEAKVGAIMAKHIEDGLFRMVDADIIPRDTGGKEPGSAVHIEEIKAEPLSV